MHTIPRVLSEDSARRTPECLSSYQIAMASLGVMSISVSLACPAEHDAPSCPGSQMPAEGDAVNNDHAGLCAWQVHRLTAYIDAHIHMPIRTVDLAQALNLSVSHFSRAFKRACGMTPRDFILRKRVAHACLAMKQQDIKLTEIAHTLGLYDQSHFTLVFKKLSGQSPQAWRRQACLADVSE